MDNVFPDMSFDSLVAMASGTFDAPPVRTLSSSISPKRNVVFSRRVRVLEIPSAKTLTKKERKALWYPEPSDERKSKLRQLLCVVDDVFDDDRYDIRDEEDFGEPGLDHLDERRRLPVSAVLVEQSSQKQLRMQDPEFIAKIYRQCSEQSVVRAQMRAIQDEAEARRISGTTASSMAALALPMKRAKSRIKLFRRRSDRKSEFRDD